MMPLPGLNLKLKDPVLLSGANSRPPSWPVPDDFAVVIDKSGNVVCRVSDDTWDLKVWEGKPLSLTFTLSTNASSNDIEQENIRLLKRVATWRLWGPNATQSPRSLVTDISALKPFFKQCTKEKVLVTRACRHPALLRDIATNYPPSYATKLITFFHDIWFSRAEFGVDVLPPESIKILATNIPEFDPVQTACIPPRIWSYQNKRAFECIAEYLKHEDAIKKVFYWGLELYAEKAGSLEAVYEMRIGAQGKLRESFKQTLLRFGLTALFERWGISQRSFQGLTSYFTLVQHASAIYIQNYSLMRKNECESLPYDCFSCEKTELFDDVYMLCGTTSKTVDDHDARWVVAETVGDAVKACQSIADMLLHCAKAQKNVNKLDPEGFEERTLFVRSFEPWANLKGGKFSYRVLTNYDRVVSNYPKFLDANELEITQVDYDFAIALTPALKNSQMCVGNSWPMRYHQLRRTGAVNMLASGVVSEQSLRYQLKHLSLQMTRYYGQGWYKTNGVWNAKARRNFIVEMYQAVMRGLRELNADRFISPYGESHKQTVLSKVSKQEDERLLDHAKAGEVGYRRTIFGACTKSGPACPMGGVSNVSECMGFQTKKPCEWVLLDKANIDEIVELEEILTEHRTVAEKEPQDPVLLEALKAQIESTIRAKQYIYDNAA